MRLLLVALFNFIFGVAEANEELRTLILCHESLDEKSQGQSTKLSPNSATPFVLPSGKRLYFITDQSISVLDNLFADKEVVFQLKENNLDFYRKVQFNKSAEPSTISYVEPSPSEKASAIQPKPSLDEASLKLLKAELVRRVRSLSGEYQNKYNPTETITSISSCLDVKSPELQKELKKQIQFYEKLLPYKMPSSSTGTR